MPKFKNISSKDICILSNGRKITIPRGAIVDGPDNFKMYSSLKLVSDKEYNNFSSHVTKILREDPMNRLRGFINQNSNSSSMHIKALSEFPKQSNIDICNHVESYINKLNSISGAFINVKASPSNYEKIKSYTDHIRFDYMSVNNHVVTLEINDNVDITYDFISYFEKKCINSKINLPDVLILENTSKEYIDDIAKTYKIKKDMCSITIVTLMHITSQYLDFISDLKKQTTQEDIDIIAIPNFKKTFNSCAEPLNIGVDMADSEIVNCCHQDLRVNSNWVGCILNHIRNFSKNNIKWGVLGMAGAYKWNKAHTPESEGNILYLSDLTKNKISYATIYRQVFGAYKEVQTVDELALIFNKSSNIRFDFDMLNHFHWYGTDICLSFLSKGYKNFAIDADCLHLSDGQGNLTQGHKDSYTQQAIKLFKKWENVFPYFKSTTATFFIKEKAIIPGIFILINMKNGNKNLPEIIHVP